MSFLGETVTSFSDFYTKFYCSSDFNVNVISCSKHFAIAGKAQDTSILFE